VVSSYRYGGAKGGLQGRGFLGFRWMNVKDEQTGIYTTTEYRQDVPYVGQVSATCSYLDDAAKTCDEVAASGTATLLETLANTWSTKPLNAGATVFPFVSQSVAQTFEPNDGAGNSYVTQVSTASTYDDWGNPLTIAVDTTDGVKTWSKVTTNVYGADDVAKGHLGRLTQASVTSTVPDEVAGSGTLSATRTSSFAYDPSTGLLTEEVVEPGTALEQRTTYTSDAYGNRSSVSVTLDHDLDAQTPVQTRTTSTVWSHRDAQGAIVVPYSGRFPVQVTNALGHTEDRDFAAATGQMTSLTGANGLSTTWSHDGFGRVAAEQRADGTSTTTVRALCTDPSVSCPGAAHTRIATIAIGAPAQALYLDTLAREVRRESEGLLAAFTQAILQ